MVFSFQREENAMRLRACSHYRSPSTMSAKLMKADEHDIELFEPREDAPKALESAEQPFDLVASFVHGAVVFPRRDPTLLGWHHWDEAKVERQLSRLIAFVCPVHQQIYRPWRLAQLAALGRIVGLAG